MDIEGALALGTALAAGLMFGARAGSALVLCLFLVLPVHAFGVSDGISLAEATLIGVAPSVFRSRLRLDPTPQFGWTMLLAGWVLAVAAFFLLSGASIASISVLRDLRGSLCLIGLIVLIQADARPLPKALLAAVPWIVLVGAMMDLFAGSFGSALGLEPVGLAAAYEERTGVVRYADAGTLALFGLASVLALSAEARTWHRAIGILGMLVVAVTSGLRFQAVWAVFAMLAVAVRGREHDALRRLSAVLLAITAVGGTAIFAATGGFDGTSIGARLSEGSSPAELLAVVANRVVVPVVGAGWSATPQNALIGAGPQFLFFIPWFEYRLGTVWHFSVDSSVVFWFIKYGLLGLALSLASIRSLTRDWGLSMLWIWPYAAAHNVLSVESFIILGALLLALASPHALFVARTSEGAPLPSRGG